MDLFQTVRSCRIVGIFHYLDVLMCENLFAVFEKQPQSRIKSLQLIRNPIFHYETVKKNLHRVQNNKCPLIFLRKKKAVFQLLIAKRLLTISRHHPRVCEDKLKMKIKHFPLFVISESIFTLYMYSDSHAYLSEAFPCLFSEQLFLFFFLVQKPVKYELFLVFAQHKVAVGHCLVTYNSWGCLMFPSSLLIRQITKPSNERTLKAIMFIIRILQMNR